MIGRLRGVILDLDANVALLEAGGVGYEVSVPDSVYLELRINEEAVLLTRQIFREDGVSLYGFLLPFQRRLFDLLLSVKGCGPKVGLALIGQLGEDSVASSILAQDARALSRATGVGPRLAERIILELKDKVQAEQFQRRALATEPRKKPSAIEDELVDALLALGYRRSEAEAAAETARDEATAVEDQLKIALRALQK